MTANRNLERRLTDFYASEAPNRAPDWVLERALDAIDQTKQQRPVIGALRRIPAMSTFSKLAAAAVVIVGVVAFGAMAFRPGAGPGGPGPSPSASPSPSPSPSAVATPSVGPSPSPALTPAPLAATFVSPRNGIAIEYPGAWSVTPAVRPATTIGPSFGDGAADYLYDPVLEADLFIMLTSWTLDGQTGEAWGTAYLEDPTEGCPGASSPIVIDGAQGLACDEGGQAVAWTDEFGWVIQLYTSNDRPAVNVAYSRAWFGDLLETVDLRPEDVVTDASPSASP